MNDHTAQTPATPDGAASALTGGLERLCGVCREELFDHELNYCDDCRDGGDLEAVLERGLEAN
jgi:hypothetical protein